MSIFFSSQKETLKGIVLTIVVPAYNCAKTIKSMLDSFDYNFSQFFEVLIVDDGSTEPFYPIVKPYTQLYPDCVKYFKKKNGNWGSVINYVRKNNLIRGKWVKILDSDDQLVKENFSYFIYFLRQYYTNKNDLVISSYNLKFCNENKIEKKYAPFSHHWLTITSFDHIKRFSSILSHHYLIISTELLNKCNYLPENIGYVDNILIYQIIYHSKKFICTKKKIFFYIYNIGYSDNQQIAILNFLKNKPAQMNALRVVLTTENIPDEKHKLRRNLLLNHIKRMIYLIVLLICVDKRTSKEYKDYELSNLNALIMKTKNGLSPSTLFFSNPLLLTTYYKNIFMLKLIYNSVYYFTNFGMFKAIKKSRKKDLESLF